MNIKHFAALCMALGITACSKDENNESVVVSAPPSYHLQSIPRQMVVGIWTYSCDATSVSVMGGHKITARLFDLNSHPVYDGFTFDEMKIDNGYSVTTVVPVEQVQLSTSELKAVAEPVAGLVPGQGIDVVIKVHDLGGQAPFEIRADRIVINASN